MAHEVIMPALGMAQETGVIVAWLKRQGDTVAAGEPLFEVETDKAVMSVEAAQSGVLSEVRHNPGDEVPVGQVIAVIAPEGAMPASRPSKPEPLPPAAHDGLETAKGSHPGSAALRKADAPSAGVASRPFAVPNGQTGRVLASPKARRLAAERGIDLRRLVSAGAPQPFHAADLDRVAALPASQGARNRLAARAEGGALAAFRKVLEAESGTALSNAVLWAAFAAGALREGRDQPIIVAVETLGQPVLRYAEPDRGPLAEIVEEKGDGAPTLTIRDLTNSRLTDLELARDGGPVLSIARGEGAYALTLSWPEGTLSEPEALALASGLAARIEQPLRHLL